MPMACMRCTCSPPSTYFSNFSVPFFMTTVQKMLNVIQQTQRNDNQSVGMQSSSIQTLVCVGTIIRHLALITLSYHS